MGHTRRSPNKNLSRALAVLLIGVGATSPFLPEHEKKFDLTIPYEPYGDPQHPDTSFAEPFTTHGTYKKGVFTRFVTVASGIHISKEVCIGNEMMTIQNLRDGWTVTSLSVGQAGEKTHPCDDGYMYRSEANKIFGPLPYSTTHGQYTIIDKGIRKGY